MCWPDLRAKEGAARVSVGSPRRKEIMWLAKKCHRKQGLRRRVLFAGRKWSLYASHQFCSAGSSRISRSHARSAVLRKNSGPSAFEDLIEQQKSVALAHTSDLVAIPQSPQKPTSACAAISVTERHEARWHRHPRAGSTTSFRATITTTRVDMA